MVADGDPTAEHLEVYDTKSGLWHPELGELHTARRLPAGDAFVTRRVKAACIYWVLFRPKGRREHRRQLGLLAPADAIASAQIEAGTTASRRDPRTCSKFPPARQERSQVSRRVRKRRDAVVELLFGACGDGERDRSRVGSLGGSRRQRTSWSNQDRYPRGSRGVGGAGVHPSPLHRLRGSAVFARTRPCSTKTSAPTSSRLASTERSNRPHTAPSTPSSTSIANLIDERPYTVDIALNFPKSTGAKRSISGIRSARATSTPGNPRKCEQPC